MEIKQGTWRKFLTPANILAIITVIIGLIAIPVRTFAQNTPLIDQAVLAIVTLLAGTQLASNYAAIKQEEKWDAHQLVQQDIAQIIKEFPSGSLKRRGKIVPLEDFASKAKGIIIIARTASKIAGRFDFFRDQLEQGCRIRFVVTNPEAFRQNDIEAVTPMPSTGEQALEFFTAELKNTLINIDKLQSLLKGTPGKVEVRLVNYISNMSFVSVDEGNNRGKIIVELMPYKVSEQARPHIELSSRDPNTDWYDLFKRTSEEIWRNATPLVE